MKPQINFPDISHSEAEKRNLAKFRELHEKDDPKATFKAIFALSISFIFAIGGTCFIILNVPWKALVHWYNDLPWVGNLFILLPSLAIILWFYIRRSARKG